MINPVLEEFWDPFISNLIKECDRGWVMSWWKNGQLVPYKINKEEKNKKIITFICENKTYPSWLLKNWRHPLRSIFEEDISNVYFFDFQYSADKNSFYLRCQVG